MRRSPALPFIDGVIPDDPGQSLAKKIQRIFPARQSDGLKERRMGDPDDALVAQCREGDPAAFEELIRKHQRMIYSLTYRMTGSVADAEDMAQEAFIRAYRRIGAYRSECKFSTWLYRIAMNVCLTWRERETMRVAVHENWSRDHALDGAGEAAPPAANGMDGSVHAALLRLPAKQRAAVMLTFYEGLNHAEAAKVLGCPEATVSWRVFVARRKLKGWISRGKSERE